MSSSAPTQSPTSDSGPGSSGSSVAQDTSGTSSSSPSSSPPPPISSTNEPSTNSPASTIFTTSISTTTASANPTTIQETPTTIPQSIPAQTTPPVVVVTTPASAQSPTNAPPVTVASEESHSFATPTTTSTSTFTSQVPTTISSTNAEGSVVVFTSTIPEVFTTSITSGGSISGNSGGGGSGSGGGGGGGGSNNTGIIVGAVVGGVTGVILLAILIFCIRRRTRREEFDGNFDPDRVVVDSGTHPRLDLADDVSPFPRNQSYIDQGDPSMRQYDKSPYTSMPPSLGGSGYTSTEFYPAGAVGAGMSGIDTQPQFRQPSSGPPPPGAYAPHINMYGTGPVDWHTPRPGASPPASVSGNTSSSRGTKEREATGRGTQGTGLGLATQHEVAEGSGDLVVHQDAGRAPVEDHAPPREIPPAYESIQQD